MVVKNVLVMIFNGTKNNRPSRPKASPPNQTNIGRCFKLWLSTLFFLGFSNWAYSGTLDDLFSLSKDSIYAPATLRIYDLMGEHAAVMNVTVNYNSSERFRVTAFGAESCCTLVPKIPVPGKKMDIEWIVDPNPGEKLVRDKDGMIEKAYEEHASHYITYRKTLPYPDYKETAGVNLFFMPCNEVHLVIDSEQYRRLISKFNFDINAEKEWGVKTCPKP